MIGNGERVGRRRRDGPGRVAWTAAVALLVAVPVAAVALLVAVPVAAVAQVQPPPLRIYSDDFSGVSSAAAPGASRGTAIAVDVDVLDEFEVDTLAIEVRIRAHVADTGAHVPHGHPAHRHGGGPISVSAADAGGHGPLRELLARLVDTLVPLAQAQGQPPRLQVYTEDVGGPSSTAPVTPRTDLNATLDVNIPLIDTARDLIARLDQAITVHVAARPGHAHGHPH